jgi:hypothetical protein
MLEFSHPIQCRAPHVLLTLPQFQELLLKEIGNMPGGAPDIAVVFRGADGSEITARDLSALYIIDERVPHVIVNPTVLVRSISANGLYEIRIGFQSGLKPNELNQGYYLTVRAPEQVWASGVSTAVSQWLSRKQTLTQRYSRFNPLMGVLGTLFLAFGIVLPMAWMLHVTLLVAGAAFLLVFVLLEKQPHFSIAVRAEASNKLTLANIGILVGIISAIASLVLALLTYLK